MCYRKEGRKANRIKASGLFYVHGVPALTAAIRQKIPPFVPPFVKSGDVAEKMGGQYAKRQASKGDHH